MRAIFVLALAALLAAAGAVAFFYDTVYGFVVPALVLFSRRFAMRMVFRFFWVLLFVPLWPESWRHAYFASIESLNVRMSRAWAYVWIVWHFSSLPVRAAMTLIGALLAGCAVLFWLLVPVEVGRIPLIGPWLRETALPYLLRTSTMKGIEANLQPVLRKLPRQVRALFERPYKWLWWRTARRAVKTRQAIGRRALALELRKIAESPELIEIKGRYY